MSLAVDSKARFAYTVAADHFLCKYRISDLVRSYRFAVHSWIFR
mgnify:CR=1 FL=1|jgi:hypothetical protein